MKDARETIIASLRQHLHTFAAGHDSSDSSWFRRITVPLSNASVIGWLSNQSLLPHVYWSARDQSFEMAGIGVAHRIFACAPMENVMQEVFELGNRILEGSDDGVRFYGGAAFGGDRINADAWAAFGEVQFVIPRIEMWRDHSGVYLSYNVHDNEDQNEEERLTSFIDQVVFSDSLNVEPLHTPLARNDRPTKEGWTQSVQAALDAFSSGELSKIVLARESTFSFDHEIHPLSLLSRLKSVTPDCFHFCMKLDELGAFLGASPERLYARKGNFIESEAVAGTRPRGDDAESDSHLAAELLNSEKDQREHAFVRDAIMQGLGSLTFELGIDDSPALQKLARGQHLFSGVRGDLLDHVSNDQIMKALHPTPAVAGTPARAAIARIAELEPFSRGWYAGPMGWFSLKDAEFAVAIRSALVAGDQLALYSGAGIVEGSTSESEWREIENKIADFINIITSG